jgi:hypothetical protein
LLATLLEKVTRLGFTQENLVSAANRDYGKTLLEELTVEEIHWLDKRLEDAAQRRTAEPAAARTARPVRSS